MATTKHIYTPIVKGKMWDLKALGKLSSKTRAITKPLVEAMPVPKDRSVDEHLDKFTHYLKKYYPIGQLFVDYYGLVPGAVTDDGVSAVIAGFRLLKQKGRLATPTYGFARDDAVWPELRQVVAAFGQGFCFRIDIDDMDDLAEDTWSQIIERSAELGLQPNHIDLIVDLRDIRERDVSELKDLVIDFLSFKPLGHQYRSISVVGSSALKTVTDIPKDGEGDIQRTELRLWSQLQVDLGESLEILYGDYGVIHPEFTDSGPNKNKNAKIRYTYGVNIRYFRGHKLADPPGFAQFHILAERVRTSSAYRGREFSFGDTYLDDCADLNTGSGHLGNWVQADMNHHIEYAALQVVRLRVEIQEVSSVEDAEELLLAE